VARGKRNVESRDLGDRRLPAFRRQPSTFHSLHSTFYIPLSTFHLPPSTARPPSPAPPLSDFRTKSQASSKGESNPERPQGAEFPQILALPNFQRTNPIPASAACESLYYTYVHISVNRLFFRLVLSGRLAMVYSDEILSAVCKARIPCLTFAPAPLRRGLNELHLGRVPSECGNSVPPCSRTRNRSNLAGLGAVWTPSPSWAKKRRRSSSLQKIRCRPLPRLVTW
jgi:hypothetical protein